MRPRHILGFLIAPALAILLVSITDHLTELHAEWEPWRDFEQFALLAYVATLLFGVPTHVLFRRWHFLRLWHYVVAGLAIGIVTALVVFLIIGWDGFVPAIGLASAWGLFGALVAALFWRIAIYLKAKAEV